MFRPAEVPIFNDAAHRTSSILAWDPLKGALEPGAMVAALFVTRVVSMFVAWFPFQLNLL